VTTHFVVKQGHVRTGRGQDGTFHFFLPGVHRLFDPFMNVDREDIPVTQEVIVHGNRSIVTVSQGFIGLCYDRGLPVLLPPGMHQWKSETLVFHDRIDLAQAVVHLGPYTLVTVDEGYAAITTDNGKMAILSGGQMHMLTHRNWKFEKFLTQKIQADDLRSMQATTANNVVLELTANISWVIADVALAAKMATDTMSSGGDDLEQIKTDVLKQCSASLSAFVSGLSYAEKVGVSAATQKSAADATVFDAGRMASAVAHANSICTCYGVQVIGINILSASPKDQRLSEAMALGAVAQANAEQAEATALGQAKALMITTKAQADAARVKAEADVDAARKLEQSPLAVELARMQKAGEAISEKHALFFGAGSPAMLPGLLANPVVAQSKL
jgi:regulator of protease activity HflC (stomatin/prohibitin superfamily)